MEVTTYYSLTSMVEAGRRKACDKEVISFDLFDTLLVRRIHDPDLVKLPVARYIAELAKQQGRHWHWQKVQERRDHIEQKHRAETAIQFADHEACYPLFMRELLLEIFQSSYDDVLLEKVTDYELTMENSMLVPRQILVEWIKELAGAGKRIFIISDMYLPATHLRQLLKYAGLNEFVEEVISSADTFLAKASGKAYPMIAEKYSLSPRAWMHIGDNPISDGMRAGEAGIDAMIIHDPGEQQRKSIVKRYYNYSDGRPFWRGRVLQQLMAPLEAENQLNSALYSEGYNFLGPLIGVFIQQVARFCKENEITKIFFLSREGWTFKRYWEKAMPSLYPAGGLPEIEYLYVSRMALAGASCAHQGLTKANADITFLPPGNRDFRDVCRIFSLEPEAFICHLTKFGLQADTCLSHVHDGYVPKNRKNFDAMLEDDSFQDEVKRQTGEQSLAMQQYFAQAGLFDHKHIALVDIGWLGTIQRFLFEAIAHRADCPTCFGLLFGATRGIPYPESDKNIIKGIMYDRNRFDLAASTLSYAQDIFEEACRAPHPTLNGYRLTKEGFELEFRQTNDAIGKAELEQDGYFMPLQQGIIDSAERFAAAAALLGYYFEDWKPWLNYLLVTKLAFPRTKEVANIRHRHHLDDFHGSKKPKSDFGKGLVPLWSQSQLRLKFNPFLRMRCFFSHLRRRINE
ncbi:MAG: HAD hydrolase-like protein [Proteobacteria bacterium]|nr:HAD hydrolase-like protein [Pseudomonadota bacterium]